MINIVDHASAVAYTADAIQRRDIRSVREGYIWIATFSGKKSGRGAKAEVRAMISAAGQNPADYFG